MACEPPYALPAPYVYGPFAYPSDEIRVLQLKAALVQLPDGQEVPQGTLETVRLADGPSYTALSYCWGDATDTTIMLLDRRAKRITRNLSAYLLQKVEWMRELEHESCICWIDAISINQEDDEEKSQQVQLMGQIFSNASAVDAWVGPADPDTPGAFDCIRNVRMLVPEIGHLYPDSSLDAVRAMLNVLSYLSDHLTDQIIPLHNLVQREWWRRVWVQQEILLASSDCINLVCGATRMRWEELRFFHAVGWRAKQLVGALKRRNILPERYEPFTELLPDMLGRMFLYLWQPPEVQGHHSDDSQGLIWRLLSNSMLGDRGVGASLLVDHIYGMLGIVSDKAAVSEYVQVDYSKPGTYVFTQVARYMYQSHPRLMLSLATETDRKSDALSVEVDRDDLSFPSWAIDWTAYWAHPLSWDVIPQSNWLWAPNALYDASAGLTELCCSISGDTLHLRGVQIDCVSSAGSDQREAFRRATYDTDVGTSWLGAYDEFIQTHFELGHASMEDIVWRLPTANRELVHNVRVSDRSQGIKRASRSMVTAFEAALSFTKNSANKGGVATLSSDAEDYLYVIAYLMPHRAPFITSGGRVGVGPVTMNTDDVVFILSGFDAPFVFRRLQTGQYRLVGECYLYGVMDGETVTDDVVLETLEIV